MYSKKTFVFSVISLFFLNISFVADVAGSDAAWKKKVDKNNISVHTQKDTSSKHLKFKGEGVIKASLESLVYLMLDVDNIESWLHTSYDVRLVEKVDPATRLIHMKNHAPIIRDRDLVLTQKFVRAAPDTVVVELLSKPDAVPETKGFVRMPHFEGSWVLKRIDTESTHVTYNGSSDPGGIIPAVVSNLLLPDTPYQSIMKIRQQPFSKYSGSLHFLADLSQAEMEATRKIAEMNLVSNSNRAED